MWHASTKLPICGKQQDGLMKTWISFFPLNFWIEMVADENGSYIWETGKDMQLHVAGPTVWGYIILVSSQSGNTTFRNKKAVYMNIQTVMFTAHLEI